MGNCCGKPDPEAFAQPGRVLGASAPPASGSVPVPKTVGGPPRTLGGGAAPAGGSTSSADQDEVRRKAAEAAEARAKAANTGGKLQSALSAQKRKSRVDTLKDASDEQVRAREADEAAQARTWE
ncbi:hypothetical protein G7046_g3420 [Stylonectria norvegica]|nr:hypothetical protein G7046_g3420 [Stylonectria norvegica]